MLLCLRSELPLGVGEPGSCLKLNRGAKGQPELGVVLFSFEIY